jgi:hypothetical protein
MHWLTCTISIGLLWQQITVASLLQEAQDLISNATDSVNLFFIYTNLLTLLDLELLLVCITFYVVVYNINNNI